MSVKEKLLVSACLLGKNVKYNGKNNKIDISKLSEKYELVPFCPEVEGGLPIPRPPSEIVSNNPLKVINSSNENVTIHFKKGAEKTLALCKKLNIKKALLKEKSPSCGKNFVYDGNFNTKLKRAQGVTASLLLKNYIKIFNENEIDYMV